MVSRRSRKSSSSRLFSAKKWFSGGSGGTLDPLGVSLGLWGKQTGGNSSSSGGSGSGAPPDMFGGNGGGGPPGQSGGGGRGRKSKNEGFLEFIHNRLSALSSSKFFIGIVLICLNVASKFTTIKLSKATENYLKNGFAWQILVFCMSFMGTRDLYTSLILTILFIIFTQFLCNEDSEWCILPQSFKEQYVNTEGTGDGKENKPPPTPPSQDEIQKALQTLQTLSDSMKQPPATTPPTGETSGYDGGRPAPHASDRSNPPDPQARVART